MHAFMVVEKSLRTHIQHACRHTVNPVSSDHPGMRRNVAMNEPACTGLSGCSKKRRHSSTVLDDLLGDGNVHSVASFLTSYVPSLQHSLPSNYMKGTLICPFETLKPLEKFRVGHQNQSLSSLLDDCIWTLVQRRDSCTNPHAPEKQRDGCSWFKHNNLLCQGASMSITNNYCGLTQRQLNAAAEHCKTHFCDLHGLVGDDVVRYLLLGCSIFLSMPRDNYWQVAGPPLHQQQQQRRQHQSASSTSAAGQQQPPRRSRTRTPTTPSTGKRQRKRRKQQRPIRSLQQLPCDHALGPQSCIHRKPLFYSNSYTRTITFAFPQKTPADLWQSMTREYAQALKSTKGTAATAAETIDVAADSDQSKIMLEEILRRAKTVDYHRLLQRHCPLPKRYQELTLAELSYHGFSSQDGVVAFSQACVAHVFPLTFWCKANSATAAAAAACNPKNNNETAVRQAVRTFCTLRRNERMANKMLLQNVRVTHMAWLGGKKASCCLSRVDHERRKLLVLSILRWTFHEYLIPLLQQVFYVTESEFHAKRVLYYRKPVWALFRTRSMTKLLGLSVSQNGDDDDSGENDGLHDNSSTTVTRIPARKKQRRWPQYTELSESEAVERLADQTMGLSRLRLLPKATGVRPIATLSKHEPLMLAISAVVRKEEETLRDDDTEVDTPFGPAREKAEDEYDAPAEPAALARLPRVKAPNQSNLPTNLLLGNVFAVLRYEYRRNQESFGAGMMGLHHFYPRYHSFLKAWKKEGAARPDGRCRPLYFGSVDIRHCYDSINQEHLLGIVDKILDENDYVIQKYSVSHPIDSTGCIRRRQRKDVSLPEQLDSFGEKVRVLAKEHHGSVFVDGVKSIVVSKRQILDQLKEHLTSHMVVTKGRYGNRYLVQSSGIPQGSILSSLLCNFYYGDVEQRLGCRCTDNTPTTVTQDSSGANGLDLLARMVDDFILVTTRSRDLEKFFVTMHRGDADLGVEINKEKTNASVRVTIPNHEDAAQDLEIGNRGGTFFPWCGMLFHTATGEVRIDYSRFYDKKGGDSMTVERVRWEGESLLLQMKTNVRPRCLPILFDPSINSPKAQCVNYYQMMLFAAVKTAEYLLCCKYDMAETSSALGNVAFLVDCIDSTLWYAHTLIKDRLEKGLRAIAPERTTPNLLSRTNATWLGWHAFREIFKRVPVEAFHSLANTDVASKIDKLLANSTGTNHLRYLRNIVSAALEDIEVEKLLAGYTPS